MYQVFFLRTLVLIDWVLKLTYTKKEEKHYKTGRENK